MQASAAPAKHERHLPLGTELSSPPAGAGREGVLGGVRGGGRGGPHALPRHRALQGHSLHHLCRRALLPPSPLWACIAVVSSCSWGPTLSCDGLLWSASIPGVDEITICTHLMGPTSAASVPVSLRAWRSLLCGAAAQLIAQNWDEHVSCSAPRARPYYCTIRSQVVVQPLCILSRVFRALTKHIMPRQKVCAPARAIREVP